MKIHFIGIGGIGVSGLAHYYLTKGHQITGSDLVSSEITEALKKKGAKIIIGPHKGKNISKNIELVIYSPAVQKDNPELQKAKSYKLKAKSYPEVLGQLTKKHFTIAVCGTHGKSTTTAMIGLLLRKAGFDPTVIVGTKLKEFNNSNCRVGKSKYLVIEADEWNASFLNYWPKIIVLTNLEPDHLDYYKNFKNYILAFRKFISHLPKNGNLIANKDDKNIYPTFSTIVENVVYYSLRQREAKKLKRILKIPGEHNVSNALAVLTVARVLKIPDKISFETLSEYQGAWRRFEIKQTNLVKSGNKPVRITIISDYGHHPTEIAATLKSAREKYPKKEIWCVYQPHQYQRTFYLFADFVKVFAKALKLNWVNKLILTDIYDVAGREEKKIKEEVSTKKLAEAIVRVIKNSNISRFRPLESFLGEGGGDKKGQAGQEKQRVREEQGSGEEQGDQRGREGRGSQGECSEKGKEKEQEKVVYIPNFQNFQKIKIYLKKNLKNEQVLIIMGAGDIYKLAENFNSCQEKT